MFFILPSFIARPSTLVSTFVICWLSSRRLSKQEAGVGKAENKDIEEDDIVVELQSVTKGFANISVDFLKALTKRLALWNRPESTSHFFFHPDKKFKAMDTLWELSS